MEDLLCRNLFALLRTESLPIYTVTLRVIFVTLEALQPKLKYQTGRFFTIASEVRFVFEPSSRQNSLVRESM